MTANINRKADSERIMCVKDRLRQAGLQSTRQRLSVGERLFCDEGRHVTAEILYQELLERGVRMSLATVYNTLHQFVTAGLMRKVANFGSTAWFDTTTGPHYHFYDERRQRMFDVPDDTTLEPGLPEPPMGMEIVGVDLVFRVRQSGAKGDG